MFVGDSIPWFARVLVEVAQIVHKSMEAAVIPLPLAALTEEGQAR